MGVTSSFPGPSRATVNTTDATPTTLATFPVPTNSAITFSGSVSALRTGGISGASGDSAGYDVNCTFKNVSGTVSIIVQGEQFAAEDQSGWGVSFGASGTNGTLIVTGASGNNITWNALYNLLAVT